VTSAFNAAGAVVAEVELAAGKTKEIDFYLGWHMPHHVTSPSQTDYGKYYANHFTNAMSAASYLLANRKRLVDETMAWQDLILKSSLPYWLKFRIINGNFPLYANTVFSKKGIFATIESPITMMGALGTMDQRMASHGFTSQMYTDLDRRELSSFAKCQRSDGRITHFTGNFHQVLENPDVSYGITDWPDLSCSWIMQVAKQYRFTGDTAYMRKSWPSIKKNLLWLEKQDKDGDFIPEGGNTYDYEKAPAGMFIYNASCYLGALQTSIELARVMKDKAFGRTLEARFAIARDSVIKHLWNGSFFIKWKDHAAKTRNSNSFIASLAGDWLVRLIGLEATLPFPIVKKNLEYVLDRHVAKQSMVPPMEVDAKGKPAVYASYILQHDPYLGMESIYAGMADAGIEVLRRNFEAVWIKNHVGWNLPLSFNAITGRQIMLYTYMTATSAWHVFNALAGSTLDLSDNALYLNPQTFGNAKKIELPLWYPGFWLWLTYNASSGRATIKVIKVFKPGIVLTKLKKVTKEGTVVERALKKAFHVRMNNKLVVSV
jgi:uncharacterized protein (DUF608 family)